MQPLKNVVYHDNTKVAPTFVSEVIDKDNVWLGKLFSHYRPLLA